MFTEVSAPCRRGLALSCPCQGDVRRWLQWEEVKPGQVAEPCEVGAGVGRPCLGLAFAPGWEQLAEGWDSRERGLFSVSLVIADCLM